MEPLFFDDAEALRAWVRDNAADESEVWLGFHRVRYAAGAPVGPRVRECAEELAAVGWVETGRAPVDRDRYAVRFAPGKVRAARARRMPEGPWEPPVLAAEYAERLASDPAASAFFDAQPPRYRNAAIWWVMGGKAEETRERRITALVEACARGEKLMALQRNL